MLVIFFFFFGCGGARGLVNIISLLSAAAQAATPPSEKGKENMRPRLRSQIAALVVIHSAFATDFRGERDGCQGEREGEGEDLRR